MRNQATWLGRLCFSPDLAAASCLIAIPNIELRLARTAEQRGQSALGRRGARVTHFRKAAETPFNLICEVRR
jgi:hypothetical protein